MLRYIYRCSGKIANFFFPWRKSAKAVNSLWYQVRKNKESIKAIYTFLAHLDTCKANKPEMKKRGRPVGRPRKK
jgi:hypothetical protein